jgi:hypothetical protein
MTEKDRINIVIRRENNPLVFDYMMQEKSDNPKSSYTDILEKSISELNQLKDQALTKNDWTGMRLALRATEKNSHLTLELLNNILLNSHYPTSLMHKEKSLQLAQAETNWKDLMQGFQAEKSTKKAPSLQDFAQADDEEKTMPSFDFKE